MNRTRPVIANRLLQTSMMVSSQPVSIASIGSYARIPSLFRKAKTRRANQEQVHAKEMVVGRSSERPHRVFSRPRVGRHSNYGSRKGCGREAGDLDEVENRHSFGAACR